MEEIYKPDADGPEKVEVYSRENNDMLGDMPEWLIHTGSYIVYGLIVFLIAGTALFKYPDTIRKTITIDDLGSAEWISSISWKAGEEQITRGYRFTYDGLDRMKKAEYGEGERLASLADSSSRTGQIAKRNIPAMKITMIYFEVNNVLY